MGATFPITTVGVNCNTLISTGASQLHNIHIFYTLMQDKLGCTNDKSGCPWGLGGPGGPEPLGGLGTTTRQSRWTLRTFTMQT